jgi:hypothetical protein
MSGYQPEPTGFAQKTRIRLEMALFICQTWSTSIEVFLHRDMGERYLGLQAFCVVLLVPIFGLFWEGYDLEPLFLFISAYMVMCYVNRVQMVARRKRGEQCHSRYSGWPRFLGPKAKFSEMTMKRIVEPVITLLIGAVVRDSNAPLGTYLMLGAVAMFITVSASQQAHRAQAQEMYDAVAEQEMVADTFREMHGDR